MKNPRNPYTIPLLLALLTAAGLLFALIADGWGDWLSWFFLAMPVLACAAILRGKTLRGTKTSNRG